MATKPTTTTTPPASTMGSTAPSASATGPTINVAPPFVPDTDTIFGDPNSADQQSQAASTALQGIYGSSFALTPIQERQVRVPWQASDHPYLPGGSANAAEYALGKSTTSAVLAGQLYNEVIGMSRAKPDQYQNLQYDMYMAGMYGKAKLDAVDWGAVNDQSVSALTNLFQLTAQINASLKSQRQPTITWQQVLSEQKGKVAPMMQAFLAKAQASSNASNAPRIVLQDPNALASALDQVSQNTIGRRSTAEEQRMFVAGFHAMQTNEQATQTGTYVAPDVGGEAKAQLEANNHDEKTGYDMLTTFGNFMKIMGH